MINKIDYARNVTHNLVTVITKCRDVSFTMKIDTCRDLRNLPYLLDLPYLLLSFCQWIFFHFANGYFTFLALFSCGLFLSCLEM